MDALGGALGLASLFMGNPAGLGGLGGLFGAGSQLLGEAA